MDRDKENERAREKGRLTVCPEMVIYTKRAREATNSDVSVFSLRSQPNSRKDYRCGFEG